VSAVLVDEVDIFTTTLVLPVSAEVDIGAVALFCWTRTVFVAAEGWRRVEGRRLDDWCCVPDAPVVTMTQGLDDEADDG
jgi:hypothetical protein